MCRVFKIGKSGFYDWLKRKPSRTQIETEQLRKEIKQEYDDSEKRYGSPKITVQLNNRGIKASRPRVGRLMKSMGIKSIIHKKFKVVTTDSDHDYRIAENHLNRQFTVDDPCKVWVSDITYIPTDEGWLYLTIIMDLFDRNLVGWSMSNNMTATDTVVKAWNMAVVNRKPKSQLMFHSDRGVQYACDEFRKILGQFNVLQSMSRKANCWDNAVAENFFKILKSELVYHNHFLNHKQAKQEIFEFIEIWYNRKRIHSTLNNLTPLQYYNNYFFNRA